MRVTINNHDSNTNDRQYIPPMITSKVMREIMPCNLISSSKNSKAK